MRVGFVDQSDGGLGRRIVKRVGDIAQAIKAMTKRDVIVPQLLTGRRRQDAGASAHGRVQRPQCVENDGDVDQLLNERRRHRRDKAEHRRHHGEARIRLMPTTMLSSAMRRARWAMTTASATRSSRSAMITTSAASEEALAPRAPMRDADIGGGERRRVVDAVADHGGREKPLLAAHGIDLVRRHAVGEHGIEVERGADGLRRGGVIAGDHDDARDARRPQHADRMRRFGAQFVGQAAARRSVRPSTATNTTSADRQEARRMTRSAQSSGSRWA